MSLISSGDLAYMRSTINELLPDSCNLLTVTQTADGQGGFTESWGTAAGGTAVSCRLDYFGGARGISGRERTVGESLRPYEGFVVTLPNGTAITEQYRVEINSIHYNVTAVDNGKSWGASVRVAVEKT